MSAILRGNRDLIRSINRSILLNAIKTQGEISRAALAHMTGLSPATVTGITGQLIQEGLVFEKATGDSTGGRPPIMLALNPRGGFVIGIKLMEGHAIGALTDLNATILAKDTIDLADKRVETSVEMLSILVNRLVQGSGVRKKQLLGVGIGLAGVVDFTHGIVRQNPFFGWRNIPLGDLLETRLQVPVFIDNDVNTLTLSEKWLNQGQPEDNFIVITVGRGIGMGIVINGQIYRGKAGGAGELRAHGGRCQRTAVRLRQARLPGKPGQRSCPGCAGAPGNWPGDCRFGRSYPTGSRRTGRRRGVLARAGALLGMQIANLVNLFDPKLIIISGEGHPHGRSVLRRGSNRFSRLCHDWFGRGYRDPGQLLGR